MLSYPCFQGSKSNALRCDRFEKETPFHCKVGSYGRLSDHSDHMWLIWMSYQWMNNIFKALSKRERIVPRPKKSHLVLITMLRLGLLPLKVVCRQHFFSTFLSSCFRSYLSRNYPWNELFLGSICFRWEKVQRINISKMDTKDMKKCAKVVLKSHKVVNKIMMSSVCQFFEKDA